jgi:ribonuclease BN (tRNA processing enzyme)
VTPAGVTLRFAGSGDAFGSGGRFQTCILVDAPGLRFAIDFGTSSLVALARQGIAHNSIDAILLTHLHGDHCGGVPFLLVDAMLAAKRTRALTIAGPRDLPARMGALSEALFPGMHAMQPKFRLDYVELATDAPTRVGDLVVTARPARHVPQTNPLALRIEVAGKVLAYTGDTEWTDEIAAIGRGADLLVAECYSYAKPITWHLTYRDLAPHLADLGARRVILTHLGPEMLARAAEVPEECAHDGLIVRI